MEGTKTHMKKFKGILALVLALVLVLGCFGTAFAQDGTTKDINAEGKLKGYQSASFKRDNDSVYSADDVVRAIVVLKKAPAAEVAERGTAKAEQYTAQLKQEHEVIYKAMAGIDFELAYEYTTLLNGFSCDVAYGDLDKIAALAGVDAVYIANHYAEPELEAPKSFYAGQITGATGNDGLATFGFEGQGTVIAVLDTGTYLDHEAFKVYFNEKKMQPKLTEADTVRAVANGKYVSMKVPFAYDYADRDDDVTDTNGHGTHCAGIATGYAYDEDGLVSFMGSAPKAQLLAMKIFKDNSGGTSSDIYFFAMEDAYRLGADVISMSIGSQNGFSYDDSLETIVFGNMYARLQAAGIIVCIAAGNEYSMAQFSTKGYITSEYTDYGTVAAPSTYPGVVSVASMENIGYPYNTLNISDGVVTMYYDREGRWAPAFEGKEVEYVIGLGIGTEADYEGKDVKGKIAVVSRGTTTFQQKIDLAAEKGAIGVVVVNTAEQMISFQIENAAIPSCSVPLSAMAKFEADDDNTFVTEYGLVPNPQAYLMSDFSNWGTTPDLNIRPTITGVGGMVYSSVIGAPNAYDVYSGTSMACPNIAGTFATLLSALSDKDGINITDKVQRAEIAKAALESTGNILFDEDGRVYSVRKQGTGLANAFNALVALMNTYTTNPIHELGDDAEKTGVYTFDVELVNNTSRDNTLTADELIIKDRLEVNKYREFVNTLTTTEVNADVTYTVKGQEVSEIVVPASGKTVVTVTVTLTEAEKTILDAMYPNGAYIEGYVAFSDEDGRRVHATFLAYYGDWTEASVMEAEDWRDAMEYEYFLATTVVPTSIGGDGIRTYADYGLTYLDVMDITTDVSTAYLVTERFGYLLDFAYAGKQTSDFNHFNAVEYNEKHISFTTALSDASFYYADEIYMAPYLMRNAKQIKMTVKDAKTGEIYLVDTWNYAKKSVYNEDNGYWSYTSEFKWNGTDANGDYVPTGTEAVVSFDVMLPYNNTVQENVWSYNVTVDYTAPVLESVEYDPIAHTITVTASDDQYLATIYLSNSNYDILDAVNFSDDEKGQSHTVTFDVSKFDFEDISVIAMDFATNEQEVIVAPHCYAADYSDTPVTAWYHKAVDFVTYHGFMNGIGEGKFDPNGCASRAVVATVIWRASGSPEAKGEIEFTDVPENAWYSEAVAWAAENEIILGRGDGTFDPMTHATREEVAVMLWRVAGKRASQQDLSEFKDADKISPWAVDAMKAMVELGIFIGDEYGNLNPREDLTRAQLAMIIMRACAGEYDCEN